MGKAEEAIDRIQEGLRCSLEEAQEIYKADCAINKGELMDFDLSKEQLAIARKFAHTGTRKSPTGLNLTRRERKPNVTKGALIAEFAKFLTENSEFEVKEVEITNKERQITFRIGENAFDLTLIQKRSKKK